jgi:hypothetical protein
MASTVGGIGTIPTLPVNFALRKDDALGKDTPMPGVGKLLKQAEKMRRSIEELQSNLETRELETSAAGGAVRVRVTAAGKFLSLALDPEFLKEDAKTVSDTILAAVQDAAKQAKDLHDAEMQKVTSALQVPGLL